MARNHTFVLTALRVFALITFAACATFLSGAGLAEEGARRKQPRTRNDAVVDGFGHAQDVAHLVRRKLLLAQTIPDPGMVMATAYWVKSSPAAR